MKSQYMITFRAGADIVEAMRELAAKLNTSRSALLRQLVRQAARELEGSDER